MVTRIVDPNNERPLTFEIPSCQPVKVHLKTDIAGLSQQNSVRS
jgi:hypothetical protein